MIRLGSLVALSLLIPCAACSESPTPAATLDASIDVGADVVVDVALDRAIVDTGPDAPDAAKAPTRLFVAHGTGVLVWNDATTLVAAAPPTTTLTDPSVASGTNGLALLGSRLFVLATTNPGSLVGFDAASTVAGAAAPAFVIPGSAFFNGSTGAQRIYVDGASDTAWTSSYLQGAQLLTGASTLTSASAPKAVFNHVAQQVPGVAYDATGDRLFLGQATNIGLLTWNAAKTKTGTPTNDFATLGFAPLSLALAQDRLYGGGNLATDAGSVPAVAIWTNVSTFSAPKPPAVTLRTAATINATVKEVSVSNDVLVVALQNDEVRLYVGAASLATDTAPSATVKGNFTGVKRALLSKTKRLFVLDGEGVAIFDSATTTPTFVTKLKPASGSVWDFTLLE